MNQLKKRNKFGRFTKEAADIIVEMLKEGVVKGKLVLANGTIRETSIHEDITDLQYPYQIGGYWYTRTLNYATSVNEHVLDIVDFVSKADRKEFKRRWKERYPKNNTESEVQVKDKDEPKLTYPLFAKSKASADIFLFTSLKEAVKLTNNGGTSWSTNWIAATDTNHWQHLTFAEAEAELFRNKDDF